MQQIPRLPLHHTHTSHQKRTTKTLHELRSQLLEHLPCIPRHCLQKRLSKRKCQRLSRQTRNPENQTRKPRHRRAPATLRPPCAYPVLKAASLFSCLTGLRLSDILQVEWSHIQDYPGRGKCVRIKTQKTDTKATIPISAQALELCGEPSEGLIFKGLTRQMFNSQLKPCLKSLELTNTSPSTASRHTYATLPNSSPTASTSTLSAKCSLTRMSAQPQIYTEVVNEKKKSHCRSYNIEEEKLIQQQGNFRNSLNLNPY